MQLSTGAINTILEDGCYALFYNLVYTVFLYTGDPPASPDDAPTGTQLAMCTRTGGSGDTARPVPDGRTMTLLGPWADTPEATGDIGWFRVKTQSDGGSSTVNNRIDGTVSEEGGGGDLIFSSVSVVDGVGTVTVDEITISAINAFLEASISGSFA